MINGEILISRLKRMSEIKALKDINNLTNYLYPGTHCPLVGANIAIGGIKDSLMVVIGTDECTYYNKAFLGSGDEFGGMMGRCVSIVLSDYDITFGGMAKAKKAFKEIIKEYKPKFVFFVSTCISEIIGDDIDSFADEMSEIYDIPVLPVHTEHFKALDHLPGLERTMQVCARLMDRQEQCDGVNFIGERSDDITKTELHKILTKTGTTTLMSIPGDCYLEDIKKASAAKANIVVDEIGIPLAKEMKKKFKIPYVEFYKVMNPDRMLNQYNKLFELLCKELPCEVMDIYNRVCAEIEEIKPIVSGKSYVYHSSPLQNLELNSYLSKLDMEPLLIQISKLNKQDIIDKDEILKKHNPFVSKSSNLVPFQHVTKELKPDLYFGPMARVGNDDRNLNMVYSMANRSMFGFEAAEHLIELIKNALNKGGAKDGVM